jgi:hypothetical protein
MSQVGVATGQTRDQEGTGDKREPSPHVEEKDVRILAEV